MFFFYWARVEWCEGWEWPGGTRAISHSQVVGSHLACSSPVGLSCGKGGGGVGMEGVVREHRKPWVVDAGARETRT